MKTLLHVKDLLLVFIVLTRQSKLTCILQVEHRKYRPFLLYNNSAHVKHLKLTRALRLLC